ncbi:MAG: dTDP-4-dehydrorhamnose 3,5-epimerase [Bacteroidales bacterium]|nr:dTDP-4-dehydrorhamnose 3,5-epimerase [Bacteroidales bacterium]
MEIIKTRLSGLLVINPKVYEDPRGYFFESYRLDLLEKEGLTGTFVQDNESLSQKGVLRGLHFQKPPFAQGKLVRVVKGSVQDVAVDIRNGSPTYGQWISEVISEKNKTMMWIPQGFAHGFLTLEDNTIFQYKCTNYYNKASEGSIRWNDPELKIKWEMEWPLLSEKDQQAPLFKDFKGDFKF